MADKKISQLTGATTPLAGTEVLPIVQGGSTVKVSAADITAGRNVGMAGLTATGNVSLDGGTFVFNESGADKDFRVEGDTNTHLIFSDASADCVGINKSAPTYKLDLVSSGTSIVRFQGPEYGQTSFTDGTRNLFIQLYDNAARFVTSSNTPLSLGTNDLNRVTLDTSGNCKVENGNFVVGAAGKGLETTGFIGINSSTATTVASGVSFIAVVRDRGNGDTALILYENNTTPVIVSQNAAKFVTGSPGANEIQIADGGSSITAKSGATIGNTNLNISIIKNQ